MATIGQLNLQWWWQDRRERVLLYTGVLCWSVTVVLILGAIGFAYPEPAVWHLFVPARAILLGVVIAMFLLTLATTVTLPGIRLAVIASFGLPIVFTIFGLTGQLAYDFSDQAPVP